MTEKTILVTGGAGYIGSIASRLLLEKGYRVVILDNLSRGNLGAVDVLKNFGNVDFCNVDLVDRDNVKGVFERFNFDSVLHFAAFCSVSESMENPSLYFRNNVVGSLNLLESMDIYKCNKLIFSSSCVVYGEGQYLPIDEKHPKEPTNPYGESKLIVEKMINWFITQKNLRAVCLRYFNPCGASTDGLMGDAKKPSVHLIQNIVRGALNIEPFKLTAPKVDTPDGSPIRDYIDINDLVDAHWKALSYLNDGGKSDVFNLGTGKGVSVLEAVQAVEKILKVNIPLENGETRKGEYAAVYADYDKARNVLGWEPSTPIIKSVENMVKWYSSHPQGYNSLS